MLAVSMSSTYRRRADQSFILGTKADSIIFMSIVPINSKQEHMMLCSSYFLILPHVQYFYLV